MFKYGRAVLDVRVREQALYTCLEIEKRYEVNFLEIGSDSDHIHFLVQSVPKNSVTQLVRMIKSDCSGSVCALSMGEKAVVGRRVLE